MKREERLFIRVSDYEKRLLETAAQDAHLSISEFARNVLIAAAIDQLKRNTNVSISMSEATKIGLAVRSGFVVHGDESKTEIKLEED